VVAVPWVVVAALVVQVPSLGAVHSVLVVGLAKAVSVDGAVAAAAEAPLAAGAGGGPAEAPLAAGAGGPGTGPFAFAFSVGIAFVAICPGPGSGLADAFITDGGLGSGRLGGLPNPSCGGRDIGPVQEVIYFFLSSK